MKMKKLANRTIDFFGENPKYVSMVDIILTEEKEKTIVYKRIHEMSLKEIGLELNLTSERVRQIEKQALEKIKIFITNL